MEDNKQGKPNNKRHYHNRNHRPRQAKPADASISAANNKNTAVPAVDTEAKAEKVQGDELEVRQNHQRHSQRPQHDRTNRNKKGKPKGFKAREEDISEFMEEAKELSPVSELREPLLKTVPSDTTPSSEEDDVISLSPDELEEIENQRELLIVDGATDIDLMAEENEGISVSSDSGIKYEVIGVRFGAAAKTYYFDPDGHTFSLGNGVIVETARGNKYGVCSMGNRMVPSEHVFLPLKKVLRAASDVDRRINEENIELGNEAFKACNIKIREHGLDMKLIDAAYTHDREKLIFFFTAPTRVDFRELVKDLASLFKTRIDLRQIGIRDEAKMIGGYGICGRPLCCCSFLPNFNQVSIKMAKEQNLSLNTSKISGVCGRLMCCLKFEHKTYLDEAKLLPPLGSLVKTADGTGVVTELSPITSSVKVKPTDGRDAIPKLYHKNDITLIKRGNERRDNAGEEEEDSNS